MPKSHRRRAPVASPDEIVLKLKNVPHEFVLDALSELDPWTRHMFGCLAVYVGDKIVLALFETGTTEHAIHWSFGKRRHRMADTSRRRSRFRGVCVARL